MIDRRDFCRLTAAGLTTAFVFPERTFAQQKTLKIVQWAHTVPAYDKWFDAFAQQWGNEHGTAVTVDHIAIGEIAARASAEAAAGAGHDMVLFVSPPASFEQEVIDHREVYEEAQRRNGKAIELALRSTFNPKTRKFFAFADSFVPDPGNYRRDLWSQAGYPNGPATYDELLAGGRRIKETAGNPTGIGLSPELDSNMALRAILWSFGGSEQDEHGNVTLQSKQTIEAVKYVRELFRSCETPEVFSWDASSNNRGMLSGRLSYAQNAISITRAAEKDNPAMSKEIQLRAALAGPARRLAPPNNTHCYAIWKFARNKDGAKEFLAHLIDHYATAFAASEFYNFPCFPATVPDLAKRLAHDPKADPPSKYAILEDAVNWTTNVGYPGYATGAIDQAINTFVIPTMFAKAARGEMAPETAVRDADAEMRRIFERWK